MKLSCLHLPAQARYWTLHCSINALPSFIVAGFYLQMMQQPLAVVAMLLAVLTFIVGYTLVTSIEGLFTDSESVLSRALKVGVKIRMMVSLISLPLLFPSPFALFLPDVWAGMMAVGAINWCGRMLGWGQDLIDTNGGTVSAPAVYAATLLEGLIISLMLMMLSFFSLLVIQGRERKKKGMDVVLPPEAHS